MAKVAVKCMKLKPDIALPCFILLHCSSIQPFYKSPAISLYNCVLFFICGNINELADTNIFKRGFPPSLHLVKDTHMAVL